MNLFRSVGAWAKAHRLRYTGIIAAVFVLQGVAVYGRLTSTTAITTETALEEFRQRQSAAEDASPAPAAQPSGGTADKPATNQPAPAQQATSGPVSVKAAAPAPAAPGCEWVCVTEFTPPAQGVYEWNQCGRSQGSCTGSGDEPAAQECFGPVCRPLPRVGQRYVAHTGGGFWNNVHIYADEHREEFDLRVDSTGVYNHRYLVNIKVGLVNGGTDIRMDPPLKFIQFPITEGSQWSGSWKDTNGKADADYSAKVAGKEEMAIGGAKVRTWIIEVTMKMKGPETTGDIFLRFWVAPEYRMTVQEFYDENLSTPDGPYRGMWSVTLKNLQARQ